MQTPTLPAFASRPVLAAQQQQQQQRLLLLLLQEQPKQHQSQRERLRPAAVPSLGQIETEQRLQGAAFALGPAS